MITIGTSDPFLSSSNVPTCAVIGSFKIPTGETCTVLAFCKHDAPINGRTMLERGDGSKASMEEADFQKFWMYRDSVPPAFWRWYFMFPGTDNDYGDVRCAGRNKDTWFCFRLNLTNTWFEDDDVLIRFES